MMMKPECYARIGENIRRLRDKAGLTQTELGKRIGAGQGTIVSAEQGTTISAMTLIALSEALDANLYDLVDFAVLEHRDAAE